jgi:hypothetical protein
MPKFSPARPDFMAPGPHVILEKKEDIRFQDEPQRDGEEDDEDSQAYRYYQSEKILGKLYRDIDEREVFREIQQRGLQSDRARPDMPFLESIWQFVMRWCRSLHWERHCGMARDIRDWYVS